MAQTGRFGIVYSLGRVGERRQFNLAVSHFQIQFIGITLFSIDFADNFQSQDFGIKVFGLFIVPGNNGHMMNGLQIHFIRFFLFSFSPLQQQIFDSHFILMYD